MSSLAPKLDWSFRASAGAAVTSAPAKLDEKLVGLLVDYFLSQIKVGEGVDGAEEGDVVALSQLEHGSVLDGARQE